MNGANLVVGYHGTHLESAETILVRGFELSSNAYDWLGDGVYFWQDAPERAWEWAVQQHGSNASVVRAEIALEDCMDMLDIGWSIVLSDAYNSFIGQAKRAKSKLMRQIGGYHRLDREVINYCVGVLAEQGIAIRVVRSAFQEGSPVFPDSAIFDRAHIQIAVRDVSLIRDVRIEAGKELT